VDTAALSKEGTEDIPAGSFDLWMDLVPYFPSASTITPRSVLVHPAKPTKIHRVTSLKPQKTYLVREGGIFLFFFRSSSPISWSPEQTDFGRLHPRARNPDITVGAVNPIAKNPDIAASRAHGLHIHKQHQWTKPNGDAHRNLCSGLNRDRHESN
jgi:hypothetical protein